MALRKDRPCPYEVMRRGKWRPAPPGTRRLAVEPASSGGSSPAPADGMADDGGGSGGPASPPASSATTATGQGAAKAGTAAAVSDVTGGHTGTSPALAEGAATPPRGFWPGMGGAGQPVVLRLPRGYAVILVVGVFALIVLSYLAGHSRGMRQGIETTRDRYESILAAAPQQDPFATPLIVEPGSAEDPRTEGYAYYRLIANHTEAVALSLVRFTRRHEVETFATVSNNGRFNVWAARAFDEDERGRLERESFLETLHSLGRAWRIEQRQPEDLFNASLIPYRP